jgi:hypothetical protein
MKNFKEYILPINESNRAQHTQFIKAKKEFEQAAETTARLINILKKQQIDENKRS